MKPNYRTQKKTTITWETTTESILCNYIVTRVGGTRSGTVQNDRVYKSVIDNYASNSISIKSSSSYSSFRIGPFGNLSETRHSWTSATITKPKISFSGTNALTTFNIWSKTAESRAVDITGSRSVSSWYEYIGNTTYTFYLTSNMISLVSDYNNTEYLTMGWAVRDYYSTYNAAVKMFDDYIASIINRGLTNQSCVSASGSYIIYSPQMGYTYTVQYPGILAKLSDPYQVRQLVYTNNQYVIFDGNLTQTVG